MRSLTSAHNDLTFWWQEQHLGQEALDFTSEILGASSSDDQLRNRLNAVTRQVSGLGRGRHCGAVGSPRTAGDRKFAGQARCAPPHSSPGDMEHAQRCGRHIPVMGSRGTSHVDVLELLFDRQGGRNVCHYSGKAIPAHCLTRRDVALFRGDNQLEYLTGDRQIG